MLRLVRAAGGSFPFVGDPRSAQGNNDTARVESLLQYTGVNPTLVDQPVKSNGMDLGSQLLLLTLGSRADMKPSTQ